LTNARVEFATSLVSFERVFEMLDLRPDVADRPAAVELASVKGEVRFENVSFSYQAAEAGGAKLPEVVRWRRGAVASLPPLGAASAQGNGPGPGAADSVAPAAPSVADGNGPADS